MNRKMDKHMAGSDEWQGRVGDTWAAEWARTDRSFSELTPRLVEAITAHRFEQAMDIGCGAGELSLRVSDRRPDAEIVGVDVSAALVDAARARGSGYPKLTFELADASSWQPAGTFRPDALFSRHGVMFFDEPVLAFANLRGLAPGSQAHLTFTCFRPIADNPFFYEIAALFPSAGAMPDPHAPGPFAFADKDRVAAILRDAGWNTVAFERIDFPMIAGAGVDPVGDAVAYFRRIGPAARALAQMDEAARHTMGERIARLAADNLAGGRVALPASAWLVTATAA